MKFSPMPQHQCWEYTIIEECQVALAPFIDPGSAPVSVHRCAAQVAQPAGSLAPAPFAKLYSH